MFPGLPDDGAADEPDEWGCRRDGSIVVRKENEREDKVRERVEAKLANSEQRLNGMHALKRGGVCRFGE